MAPLLSISRRLRRTPFSDGVEAAGVKAYTVYNRMLLATVFLISIFFAPQRGIVWRTSHDV